MEKTVKQRLLDFIYYLRITQVEFCRRLGVSSAYVTSIRQSISPEKLSAISAQYPDLNIEWLLTGKGNMLNSSHPSIHGITLTNNGNIHGNNNMNITTTSGDSYSDVPITEVEEIPQIPIIPRNIYNVPDVDVLEYIQHHHVSTSPAVMQFPAFNAWWPVFCDTMTDEYLPGDKLALRSYPIGQERILNGRTYVIDTRSNGMIIGKLTKVDGGYICKYDNTRYPDDFIEQDDVIRIYKIVGLLRVKE